MLAEQQEHPVSLRAAKGVAGGTGSPVIDGWSIVGYDRIVGMLRGTAGVPSKTIITSPVLRISFLGAARTPLALTQSGSLYALGEPADSFGSERAQHFLHYKSEEVAPAGGRPAPRLPTAHMKLET